MSYWSSKEHEIMLEEVVNLLDLSHAMIAKHGPLGSSPAEPVRDVLAEKDMQIRLLKKGFVIADKTPEELK